MRSALSLIAACAAVSCSTAPAPTPPRNPAMLADANTQLIRRLFEEYFNTGTLDRLDEVVAPDFAGLAGARGPAALAAPIATLRTGFPDIHYTVEDLVGDDDSVAVRWSWTGTHTGQFRSHAATGKKVSNSGLAIFQVRDGKVTGAQLETDRLGFLLSIGAIPYDPAYGPPPAAK